MKFLTQNLSALVTLLAVFMISITILAAALILTNGNFYIKNLGTSIEQNGKVLNTITVTGDGKVYAKPDMVNLTMSFSEVATTSAEALTKLNQKIDSALLVLKNNAVPQADISTSGLSIYPEYDYQKSVTRLVGQRATQSLVIKLKKIDTKATKATKVIDELSKIDNLQIGSISFDIEDKTSLFTQAREQAFAKAKQKASELAQLSQVRLLTPVSITDTATDITPPIARNYALMDASGSSANATTQLPSGQMEITISLSVLWGIE